MTINKTLTTLLLAATLLVSCSVPTYRYTIDITYKDGSKEQVVSKTYLEPFLDKGCICWNIYGVSAADKKYTQTSHCDVRYFTIVSKEELKAK